MCWLRVVFLAVDEWVVSEVSRRESATHPSLVLLNRNLARPQPRRTDYRIKSRNLHKTNAGYSAVFHDVTNPG